MLTSIIADAPARAFIKAIIGHNGYHGCERCTQQVIYFEGRTMTFPIICASRRTNEGFHRRQWKHHHRGQSPLIYFPSFDLIHGVPLEPMYLIDLGIVNFVKTYCSIALAGFGYQFKNVNLLIKF